MVRIFVLFSFCLILNALFRNVKESRYIPNYMSKVYSIWSSHLSAPIHLYSLNSLKVLSLLHVLKRHHANWKIVHVFLYYLQAYYFRFTLDIATVFWLLQILGLLYFCNLEHTMCHKCINVNLSRSFIFYDSSWLDLLPLTFKFIACMVRLERCTVGLNGSVLSIRNSKMKCNTYNEKLKVLYR